MSPVIDLSLDLPPLSADEFLGEIRFFMQHRGETGLANYMNIFGPRMARALDLVASGKREEVIEITKRLAAGEDPIALAEGFAKSLEVRRGQIESAIKTDTDPATADVSREDREEAEEQQKALAEAAIRRDIMEYLYLLETWYRDELVYSTTGDEGQVLNRDQLERLRAAGERKPSARAKGADYDQKFDAIEKARVYLERFLKEERVFRDLFFVLSS